MNINEINKTDKVAVYLRKSRLEGDSVEDTLAKHKDAMTRFIEEKGYTNVDWYEEVVSGEDIAHRPQMTRLLQNVGMGQYKVVLAIKFDRITRGSLSDWSEITRIFRISNTLLYTISDGRDFDFTDESTETLYSIQAVLAKAEKTSIVRRMTEGKERHFQTGKNYVSSPPYGYTLDKNTDTYPVNEQQAEVVRYIFQQYKAGYSSISIAKSLTNMEIPTPSGKTDVRWSMGYIRRMLINPFYIGFVVRNKSKIVEQIDGTKKTVKLKPNEWIKVKGTHEAIITYDDFQRVQELLESRNRYSKRGRANKFRLTALCRCKACGYSQHIRTWESKHADGNGFGYLRRCKSLKLDGTYCRENQSISEKAIFDALKISMTEHKNRLFSPKAVENMKDNLDVNPLEIQRNIIEKAQNTFARAKSLYIDGDLTRDEYEKIKTKEKERIEKAEIELEKLSVSPDVKISKQREAWADIDIEKLFLDESNPEDVNRILKLLIKEIRFLHDKKADNLEIDVIYY